MSSSPSSTSIISPIRCNGISPRGENRRSPSRRNAKYCSVPAAAPSTRSPGSEARHSTTSIPIRSGSRASHRTSTASRPHSIRRAWTRCCCWHLPQRASATRAAATFPSDPTGVSCGAGSGRSCPSCMRASPSSRRRCSQARPKGRSRCTSCSTAPRRPGGSTDCASTGCGSTSVRRGRSPWRRPRSWRAQRDPVIPRVFTIPASLPFLRTLIRALTDGRLVPEFPGAGPLALAAATISLPTRRACRAAGELLGEALGRDAAMLPRLVALGDVDEEEFAFAAAAGAASLELPPAMGALERRLLLARLIVQWARAPELHGARGTPLVAGTPAAALALADELGRLIDDMTTRQVPWDRLDELVPDRFDPYWQLSLRFLKIAREAWPKILAERGLME